MVFVNKTDVQVESVSEECNEIIGRTLYQLCDGIVWAEGPVYIDGRVIFSDVKSNRMYEYSPEKGKQIFRKFSHYANGNYLDLEQRIVSCEHGRRCISRTEHDGSVEILVDRIDGKRFNSPNDVVVKSDGSIWFTDPPYGIISDAEGYKAESQIIGCYVYRYDPDTHSVHAVITDTQRPNGLAFSPEEDVLYVADMSIVDFPTFGRRHIRAYNVAHNAITGGGTILAEISPGIPDGFRVDTKGRLYVSYEFGIKILSPEGKCLGNVLVPERVSNCTFGDGMLYITATTSLYCVEVNV